MKALILAADGFEDSELLVPFYRLREEDVEVEIVAPAPGTIRGEHGYQVEATRSVADVRPAEYDLLIVPGGPSAEALSGDRAALRVAESFLEQHKLTAAICHGPLVLIETGLMEERQATCHPSVAYALRSVHAHYLDREVVVDDNLVTSRRPADLPAFMREVMRIVHRQREARGQ